MNVIGLPEGWKMAREIDLLHDRQTFLRVNKLCAGLTVGVLALGLVIYLLWPWAFPLAGWGAQAVAALLGTLAYMLLHEAVHGVCIWAYVRRRPRFGFGGGYIWTGLKDAYFDKPSYLVIALSPVVVWGVVLLALGLALPAWFPAICFVQSINLGGAAGDYYVAHALRSLPDETLCNDTGVAMRFYVKESASQTA